MRNSHIDDFTIEEFDMLIDKYFDCELSEHEELLLRKIIASTSLDSPRIREYKAVTGYLAKAKTSRPARKVTSLRRWIHLGAAACVALILGAGVYHFQNSADSAMNQCIAYVGNDVIEDKATVMQLVENDLSALREASSIINESVVDDLQSINVAIKDFRKNDVQQP